MSSFTKGPWKIDPVFKNDILGSDGLNVATVTSKQQNRIKPDREANARLIVQAPKLYELLKEAAETLGFENNSFWYTRLGAEIIVTFRKIEGS